MAKNSGESQGNTPKAPLRGILTFHSETGTEGGDWAFQDEKFISKIPSDYGVWGGRQVWDQMNQEREGAVQEDGVEVLRDGTWYPLPDPMQMDPDYIKSSLFCGEERGDHEVDQRLMEEYEFTMLYPSQRMKLDMDERFGEGNWYINGRDSNVAIGPDGDDYYYGGTPNTEPHRPYGVAPGQLTRFNVEWQNGEVEQRLSDSVLISRWSYEGLHLLGTGDELAIFDKIDPLKVVWRGMIRLRQHKLFTEAASGMWIHADMVGWDREEWAKFFFESYRAELTPK